MIETPTKETTMTIVTSYYSERCQPYRVRMGCGHVETRMMREATAGIPWQKDLVIDVPTAKCEDCSPKARSEDDTL